MPVQKVYGKRSRAIYDPFAALISPQRKVVGREEVQVAEIADEPSRMKVKERDQGIGKDSVRTALGEKDANTVAQPITSVEKKPKRRPRATRKVVSEDEDDQHNELECVQALQEESPREAHVIDAPNQTGPQDEPEDNGRDYEPDDVPMFCDGHGYESEWDEDDVLAKEQHHPASIVGTPTINIRPPTPPPQDVYSEHCASLLELSSHAKTLFSEWTQQLSSHFSIAKIAEASFGEVYRLSLLEQLPGFSSNDESVFKIIALKPPGSALPNEKKKRAAALKKADNMSKPDDVANEVKLLQRMSSIPGFTNFRDVRVIQGRPPQMFAKAFKAFNASQKARKKEPSNFPDPAKKLSYAEDQLWAVIEMQDAGIDLERCVETNGDSNSIWFAWDVLWQVVLSLAKGEEGAEFEHRDLHLGNICVRQPSQKTCDFDTKSKLNFTGVETTIIDYTISRALMPDKTIAYHDLARDSSLFEGDSTEEYQYDIYRYMRGAVLFDDACADTSKQTELPDDRSWEQYHPTTNLIWLHFVVYKLLEQVEWPSALKAPPRKLKTAHAQWKRANDLEHVLLRVQDLLDPGVVCQSQVRSASDLVGLALRECWLDVEDVVGLRPDDSELVQQFEKLELHGRPTDAVAENVD